MWADAQRNGGPTEYNWRPLRKSRNSIPCITPQSLAGPAAGVPCRNAANIGERNTWTQSEFCTWQSGRIPLGTRALKCIHSVPAQETAKHRAVWLASAERRRCSNESKMRNPLKFAGVPQTTGPITAASRPKFTIWWGHLEEILLLNKFFFRLLIRALVAKI